MTKPTSRFASFAAAAVLVAACEAKLPTGDEMERMDVAAAEAGARRMAMLPEGAEAEFEVDGVRVTAEQARALPAERIASMEVRKMVVRAEGSTDETRRSLVRITTREAGEASAGTSGERRIRGLGADGSPFTGVLLIDGVRADPSVLRTLSPDRIVNVEVIKGSAAASLFDDPAAANGVMRITTRTVGRR